MRKTVMLIKKKNLRTDNSISYKRIVGWTISQKVIMEMKDMGNGAFDTG